MRSSQRGVGGPRGAARPGSPPARARRERSTVLLDRESTQSAAEPIVDPPAPSNHATSGEDLAHQRHRRRRLRADLDRASQQVAVACVQARAVVRRAPSAGARRRRPGRRPSCAGRRRPRDRCCSRASPGRRRAACRRGRPRGSAIAVTRPSPAARRSTVSRARGSSAVSSHTRGSPPCASITCWSLRRPAPERRASRAWPRAASRLGAAPASDSIQAVSSSESDSRSFGAAALQGLDRLARPRARCRPSVRAAGPCR